MATHAREGRGSTEIHTHRSGRFQGDPWWESLFRYRLGIDTDRIFCIGYYLSRFCRIRRRDCSLPLFLEPDLIVSHHPARAIDNRVSHGSRISLWTFCLLFRVRIFFPFSSCRNIPCRYRDSYSSLSWCDVLSWSYEGGRRILYQPQSTDSFH